MMRFVVTSCLFCLDLIFLSCLEVHRIKTCDVGPGSCFTTFKKAGLRKVLMPQCFFEIQGFAMKSCPFRG